MMCLSAPGNPLNVFIQAACLAHRACCLCGPYTHSFSSARASTSPLKPVLFFKLSQGFSLRLRLPALVVLPSLEKFTRAAAKLSSTGAPTSFHPLPLSRFLFLSMRKKERCRLMMQWPAISLHCVMFYALL